MYKGCHIAVVPVKHLLTLIVRALFDLFIFHADQGPSSTPCWTLLFLDERHHGSIDGFLVCSMNVPMNLFLYGLLGREGYEGGT